MCLNNLPCVLPMITSYKNNDMITFGTIGYVASMSAISHLLENHKHGMPGFFQTNWSYFFNRLDVIGSILTISRFVTELIENDARLILLTLPEVSGEIK